MIEQLINQYNVLDRLKISDKLIQTGGASGSVLGSNPNSKYFDYMLGLIILVIGVIILNTNLFWEKTKTKIVKIDCDDANCLIDTSYSNKEKNYTRKFSIPVENKDKFKLNDEFEVMYQINNPNIAEVSYINYYFIGCILIIIGFYFFMKKQK